MSELRILRTQHLNEWMAVLDQSIRHDFYHLPQYHALAEARGEGAAHLFLYTEGNSFIALPLLIRPIECESGVGPWGKGFCDATSVYGYVGPIASDAEMPAGFIGEFQKALTESLRQLKVVTVFTRLHPLIEQRHLLSGLGQWYQNGQTVSIDLTLPLETQRSKYRAGHRSDINRLRRMGVVCLRDRTRSHMKDFIEIYNETMHRVEAADYLFFDPAYFQGLIDRLGENLQGFVALLDGQVVAAALFVFHGDIVQYHLSGTKKEYLRLGSTKLIIDTVRQKATEQGLKVFHLGGGLGGVEDSLFRFKSGFTDSRHPFFTWRWTVLAEVAQELCQLKECWNASNGRECTTPSFFPPYRCPTRAVDPTPVQFGGGSS